MITSTGVGAVIQSRNGKSVLCDLSGFSGFCLFVFLFFSILFRFRVGAPNEEKRSEYTPDGASLVLQVTPHLHCLSAVLTDRHNADTCFVAIF